MKKDIGLLWEIFRWKDRKRIVCRVLKDACWSIGHLTNSSHRIMLCGKLYGMQSPFWITECNILVMIVHEDGAPRHYSGLWYV